MGVDRAGVQALLQAEDAGSCQGVAGDDGTLDRGGSAPGGQQGEVKVEPAVLRYLQQRGRHQAAVGDHDGDVSVQAADPLLGLLLTQGGRCAYLQAGLASQRCHR